MCYQREASTLAVLCCSSTEAQTFHEGHFYDVAEIASVPEFSARGTEISGYNEDIYGKLWYYFEPGYVVEEEDNTNRLSLAHKTFRYYEKSIGNECCAGEFQTDRHLNGSIRGSPSKSAIAIPLYFDQKFFHGKPRKLI